MAVCCVIQNAPGLALGGVVFESGWSGLELKQADDFVQVLVAATGEVDEDRLVGT